MNNKPLVTAIIPTYNEAAHIADCLTSLLEQTYLRLEIIVVDDGSTDKTVNLVRDFIEVKKSKTHITLLTQKHLGPGAARNQAAAVAHGRILVFVDADMVFDHGFINHLTAPIRQGKTIGTFSKEEYVVNTNNQWAKSWSLLRGWQQGRMHSPDQPETQAVFRAITTGAFKQSGGFDQNRGYDDDWSLSEKLATLATNAPQAIIYHKNPDSLGEIYTQSKWIAKRRYKFGLLGKLFALIRVSPIFSLINSHRLAKKHNFKPLFQAKLISDLGQLRGLIESLTGNTAR